MRQPFKTIMNQSAYEFDTDMNGFPTFTKKNINYINGILKHDSNYNSSIDKNNSEYKNTYAGMLESENFFTFPSLGVNEYDELGNTKDLLYEVIASIDKLNSTHLTAESNFKNETGAKQNKGRARVAAKIRQIGGEDLQKRLSEGCPELVNEIANAKVGGKHNFSFATKFCAYSSRHALGVDNYSIYDEVIQSVLPYYAFIYLDDDTYKKLYKTIKPTKANKNTARNESTVDQFKSNYAGYRSLIDKIINGIKIKLNIEELSYSDFDHIIWYCFKRNKGKVETALSYLELKLTKPSK